MSMSTVLVITSAPGFGLIPVFDMWLAELQNMRFARATRDKIIVHYGEVLGEVFRPPHGQNCCHGFMQVILS